MGTVVVLANMNAEKTQLYRERPPRAETTVGMAALTMVASTAARNMATMRAAVMMVRRVAFMIFRSGYGMEWFSWVDGIQLSPLDSIRGATPRGNISLS